MQKDTAVVILITIITGKNGCNNAHSGHCSYNSDKVINGEGKNYRG